MKQLKLHSFGVRLINDHKEIFLLAPDEETAKQVAEKLTPKKYKFSVEMGGWVYVDMRPAPKPDELPLHGVEAPAQKP
jgi:hypothetical protein